MDVMRKENYIKALNKVDNVLETWSNRKISIIGKITVVNTLVSTLFTNMFLCLLSPDKEFFHRYRQLVLRFLWDEKTPRICYDRLVQDYKDLGLKLINLELKDRALKASWPVRWVDRDECKLSWFYNGVPMGNSHIWECNISPKDVLRILNKDGCSISKEILYLWSWTNFKKDVKDYEEILDSKLWGNSLITQVGLPIFKKKLITSNIDRVLDIYDVVEKRFFTYEELVDVFGPNIDRLTYMAIRAAIPHSWKKVLKEGSLANELDLESRLTVLSKNRKSATKNMYWSLIEEIYPRNNSLLLLWNKDLGCPLNNDDFYELFATFVKMVKPAKLRWLQYRILTKTLTTNLMRNRWDKSVSAHCGLCNIQCEMISHLISDCEKVRSYGYC